MNKESARQACFVTCQCRHCNGHIEFDATDFEKGEALTVACPHCELDTDIFVPEQTVPPVQTDDNETRPMWDTLEATRRAAEQGDPEAQFRLGVVYYYGEGVPKDYAKAARWFRLAAQQGLSAAQFNLGTAYDLGEGVPVNSVEAMKWFRLAAEQGDFDAQLKLGRAYTVGEGVSQNFVEAFKWTNLADAASLDGARDWLDILIKQMSPSQIQEGQRLASIEALKMKAQ